MNKCAVTIIYKCSQHTVQEYACKSILAKKDYTCDSDTCFYRYLMQEVCTYAWLSYFSISSLVTVLLTFFTF